jgi:hypothetical protein
MVRDEGLIHNTRRVRAFHLLPMRIYDLIRRLAKGKKDVEGRERTVGGLHNTLPF